MMSANGRLSLPSRTTIQRAIAATVVAGVGAGLTIATAGGASAQTPAHHAAAPTAITVAAVQAAPAHAAAAVQSAPAAPAAAQSAPAAYTVVSGDWLSKIASSHNVQGGWQKLYELNKSVLTQGPDKIYPGQHLALSGTAAAPAAKPAEAPAPAPAKSTPAPAPKAATAPAKSTPAPAPATKAAPKTTTTASQDTQAASRSNTRAPLVATPAPAPVAAPAPTSSGSLQSIAASIVPADQLASFDQIISHESGWNVSATNPSSGAYGLPQSLPGNKMASAGADWQTNPATQIKWALSYMNSTYGSPNQAWAFWQIHHAY